MNTIESIALLASPQIISILGINRLAYTKLINTYEDRTKSLKELNHYGELRAETEKIIEEVKQEFNIFPKYSYELGLNMAIQYVRIDNSNNSN